MVVVVVLTRVASEWIRMGKSLTSESSSEEMGDAEAAPQSQLGVGSVPLKCLLSEMPSDQ